MAKNYTNQEIGNWMTGKAKSASGYRNKIMSNNDRNRDSTVKGKNVLLLVRSKAQRYPSYV